ncbi:MAG: LptF/LptG family permease [Candidatus Omnitrophota bacterium]|jgi:lipopolysaccharide export system permease protein
MKILQRYILSELWLPFVMSLLTLNFIFMGGYLVRAADLIIGRSVPLFDTLYVLMLALPDMVSYTVPTSVLTAILIVFGNLSQNNEIRAIKASGVHILHVMMPAFLAAMGLSILMLVFNDQVTTNAGFELRRVTKQMLIKHPMAVIEPGRFVKLDESITFLTKKLHGNQMEDIIAYQTEGADKAVRTIMARRGEVVSSPDKKEMQIRLYDGSISDTEKSSVQSIQFETYEFPTMGQSEINKMQKKKKDLTLAEILVQQENPDLDRSDRRELDSAFHQRIAFALGCFIFAFLGAPVAVLVRRGEIVISFAFAMAAACLYYVLFVGAKTFAVQGILPVIFSFWFPNFLLVGAGVCLLRSSFSR